MTPFTAKEARAILAHAPFYLCTSSASNPSREAVSVLMNTVREFKRDPAWAAVYGYALGRAVGIREERQRRKEGRT